MSPALEEIREEAIPVRKIITLKNGEKATLHTWVGGFGKQELEFLRKFKRAGLGPDGKKPLAGSKEAIEAFGRRRNLLLTHYGGKFAPQLAPMRMVRRAVGHKAGDFSEASDDSAYYSSAAQNFKSTQFRIKNPITGKFGIQRKPLYGITWVENSKGGIVAFREHYTGVPHPYAPLELQTASYTRVRPDYRGLGIFSHILDNDRQIALRLGNKYMGSEKSMYEGKDHLDFLKLSMLKAAKKASPDQIEQLGEFHAVRDELEVFGRGGMKKAEGLAYRDPSPYAIFKHDSGGDLPNKRIGAYPQYNVWVMPTDEKEELPQSISGEHADGIRRAFLIHEQDLKPRVALRFEKALNEFHGPTPAQVPLRSWQEVLYPKLSQQQQAELQAFAAKNGIRQGILRKYLNLKPVERK